MARISLPSTQTWIFECKEKRDQKLVGIELYLFSLFLTGKIYADSGYT